MRFIPPGGALVEVTTRTIQGRFLLKPGPHLNSIILGILGRAQRKYNVTLHAVVFLSNHYHLLAHVDSAVQLSRFMAYLNANLAKEVARIHHWKDRVWARRYQAVVISDEPQAQIGRLRYILSHGCKEGLVARPQDWPGVHSVDALLDDKPLQGVWINRTLEHAARQRGEAFKVYEFAEYESVSFEPLPCWKHLDRSALRRNIAEILTEVSQAHKLVEPNDEVLASRHPEDRPKKLKKSPAPLIHAASRTVRRQFLDAYRHFAIAFRQASAKLQTGDLSVVFPEGCFLPSLPRAGPLPAT